MFKIKLLTLLLIIGLFSGCAIITEDINNDLEYVKEKYEYLTSSSNNEMDEIIEGNNYQDKYKRDLRAELNKEKVLEKISPIKEITNYSKTNFTWKEKFLKPGEEVPLNKFKAFYFNTKDPTKVIYNETIDTISVNYVLDDFKNIKSEDFGAYWIGIFEYSEDTITTISISQSWAQTRLIIDGYEIYKGENTNQEIDINLSKGKHTIEIEYINNWHTVTYSAKFLPKINYISISDLSKKFTNMNDSNIWVASIYRSNTTEQDVKLNLNDNSKPTILFLLSYEATHWVISNSQNIDLIVISSYSPISTVSMSDPNIKTYYVKNLPYIYQFIPNCSIAGARYHCESNNFVQLVNTVQSISGSKPNGFSVTYSTDKLDVPEEIFDDAKYLNISETFKNNIEDLESEINGDNLDNLFQE